MVKVLSDSTCDLSPELVKRYDISIIPLHVYLGEEEYLDGDLTLEQIYDWSNTHNLTPKTSAPAMEDVIKIYKNYINDYDEMIVFTISASMSASCEVCRLAAEELGAADRIKVIDSQNLSTGVGHLVIESAVMAKEGKNVKEIEETILKLRPMVRSSFTVDTLTFLHRGGRCSGLAAFLGSALKIHPRIVVEDGAMHSDKKYRGSLDKAILKYVKDLEEILLRAKPDRVFITHSSCSKEVIEMVRDYLAGLNVFKEIFETRVGGVVAAHCGPGTLGVLFIENQ